MMPGWMRRQRTDKGRPHARNAQSGYRVHGEVLRTRYVLGRGKRADGEKLEAGPWRESGKWNAGRRNATWTGRDTHRMSW